MHRVSIIGLGWLGKPLGSHLMQRGFIVKGSCTTKEKAVMLEGEGFDVGVLRLVPHSEGVGFGKLFEADVLFVCIPPKSRTQSETFYLEQNKFLKEMAAQYGVKRIVFASSTSVYANDDLEYSEDFPITIQNSGSPGILQAERLWRDEDAFEVCVIRYGGLLGEDRIPGRYFSGKEGVVGDTRVNYIHQVDAVRVAAWVIENNLWGGVVNAVAPIHPLRRDIYEKNARDLGFPPPINYAKVGNSPSKVILPNKILQSGFKFTFPNPLDFRYVSGR